MQLNLFDDNRQVIAQNAVVSALGRRDAHSARTAISALAAVHAGDPLLPDMEILRRHVEAGPLPSRLGATEAAMHLQDAEVRLEPAVKRVFGKAANAWPSPFWLELAQAMAGLSFDPRAETLHAASLYLRAGDWLAALAAVEAIPSWRRQPVPLGWMIEARFHVDGLEAVWPLIAELAWMAPQRAGLASSRLADSRLVRLLHRFHTEFEDSDAENGFAWFPAWLLIEDGHLADRLKLAEQGCLTRPERCARLVMTLLALECQGRHAEVVENRRRLREVNGTLFAMYMRSR